MKKNIVVKYAWEEDENFKIVIADGTSQREIEGRDIDCLTQGFLQELKDDSFLNQSYASLWRVSLDAQFLEKAEDHYRFVKQQGYHLMPCFLQACRRSLILNLFLKEDEGDHQS